jgi:bacteriorhodopsin
MNIRKIFEFTAIIFISITIISLSKASRPSISEKYSSVLRLSSFTTVVAALHYFLMALSAVFQRDTLAIIMYRYADWVITTPVLLVELLALLGIQGTWQYTGTLILANIIMLVFGLYGEVYTGWSVRLWSGILGFIPLAYIAYKIYEKLQEQDHDRNSEHFGRIGWKSILAIVFGIVWALYGVVYFMGSNLTRSIAYTILDLISKGAFAAFIYAFGSDLIENI